MTYLDDQQLAELRRDVPEHLQAGVIRYIEHGVIPGEFLQAVICHELAAVVLADEISFAAVREVYRWFHNAAPSRCHGSREKMHAWSDARAAEQARSKREKEGDPWWVSLNK